MILATSIWQNTRIKRQYLVNATDTKRIITLQRESYIIILKTLLNKHQVNYMIFLYYDIIEDASDTQLVKSRKKVIIIFLYYDNTTNYRKIFELVIDHF